jgi:DNA-binding NarL/FixJ family response regulator
MNSPSVGGRTRVSWPQAGQKRGAPLEELVPLRVVGVAADESTALQWLQSPEHRAELVIVDIFLKAGSGLGLLRSARGLPRQGKFVVFSNYATPDLRRKCLELGADRVFDKSGEIDDLIRYCGDLAAARPTPPGHSAQVSE